MSSNINIQRICLYCEKEFLTVKDVAILSNSSTRTVNRLIGQGDLKALNLAERKTLIKRTDWGSLFKYINK